MKDEKTPVTIGAKVTRSTKPYASPPYRVEIDDARAIEIASDILGNEMVPIELLQLCAWVKRKAVPPKPLPPGLRVAKLGDPRPQVSDLELRDRARMRAGLPINRRSSEPEDERDTWRDLDEPKLVVDMDMP